MKKLLSLKGRERLQYELDKLMNDPDINNCFGVDYFEPDVDKSGCFSLANNSYSTGRK